MRAVILEAHFLNEETSCWSIGAFDLGNWQCYLSHSVKALLKLFLISTDDVTKQKFYPLIQIFRTVLSPSWLINYALGLFVHLLCGCSLLRCPSFMPSNTELTSPAANLPTVPFLTGYSCFITGFPASRKILEMSRHFVQIRKQKRENSPVGYHVWGIFLRNVSFAGWQICCCW